MKVLIVDRDNTVPQLIQSKLEPLGHEVFRENIKNEAVGKMSSDHFDLVFIDPTPLTTVRPVILNIRRSVTGTYPYIVLMSESISKEDALKAGTNDLLQKPLDPLALDEKLDNAQRMTSLVARIGDDSEDFPSAGGVIAKSAFNQLFLSAMDRADRYGEQTFVLFISLSNYDEILRRDGPYAADYAVAKLSQYLVLLRRQSDIIGQTSKHEYSLLLQRPLYESEPIEAANRFAESLQSYEELATTGHVNIEITVSLISLPIGSKLVEHIVVPAGAESDSA